MVKDKLTGLEAVFTDDMGNVLSISNAVNNKFVITTKGTITLTQKELTDALIALKFGTQKEEAENGRSQY